MQKFVLGAAFLLVMALIGSLLASALGNRDLGTNGADAVYGGDVCGQFGLDHLGVRVLAVGAVSGRFGLQGLEPLLQVSQVQLGHATLGLEQLDRLEVDAGHRNGGAEPVDPEHGQGEEDLRPEVRDLEHVAVDGEHWGTDLAG